MIGRQFGKKRKCIEIVMVQEDSVRRIMPNDELISAMQHPIYSQCTIMAVEVPTRRSLDTWVNFQVVADPKNEQDFEIIFPRLLTLQTDASLIQVHLDVFKHMSPLFLKYLETRERLNEDQRDWKALKKRKGLLGIPPMMTSEKWKTMNTVEQYTAVFGPHDPSRKKLEDLPYFVKVVSRRVNDVCCYCQRQTCDGCPLRFDDKTTLKQLLEQAKVPTRAEFHYEEHTPQVQVKKQNKSKKKQTRAQANRQSSYTEDLQLPVSPEFEVTVVLNARRCWALYTCLNRFIHYKDSAYRDSGENDDPE